MAFNCGGDQRRPAGTDAAAHTDRGSPRLTVPTPVGIDLLAHYDAGGFYDELLGADDDHGRAADAIRQRLGSFQIDDLRRRSEDAEREFQNLGITFLILSDDEAIDRILPFDVLPRIITAAEWERLNAGVIQRVAVLNHFLHDVYHGQKALKDGIIPAELVTGNENFTERMMGVDLPFDTYVQNLGVDLGALARRARSGQRGVLGRLELLAKASGDVHAVLQGRAANLLLEQPKPPLPV